MGPGIRKFIVVSSFLFFFHLFDQIRHHRPDAAGTRRRAKTAADAMIVIHAKFVRAVGVLITADRVLTADVDANVAIAASATRDTPVAFLQWIRWALIQARCKVYQI